MLIEKSERRLIELLARVAYTNPFLPERVTLERELLGSDFRETAPVLHFEAGYLIDGMQPNLVRLRGVAEEFVTRSRERLMNGVKATRDELDLFEDIGMFSLYMLIEEELEQFTIEPGTPGQSTRVQALWESFSAQYERCFQRIPGWGQLTPHPAEHVFAVFFQIARAFNNIFLQILGGSPAAARLRATVWQSIFSYDLKRYSRWLYGRMDQIATLITGPSGTGKELVARAIGVSQFIPFDPRKRGFSLGQNSTFYAVNLSALPPTLIESELFGHRKGAFTGATADRVGWLEQCPPTGAVFLDEIGELDGTLQVKLLRVLQTRTFQRLGETSDRTFQGKLIAATNRDLAHEMQAGRFRPDLYYRLCADQIVTPTLYEQLQQSPADLRLFVAHVARRIFGEASDNLDEFATEVVTWIDANLSRDYAWPGNFRELEQCVRNLLIHRNYQPAIFEQADATRGPLPEFLAAVGEAKLNRDELLGKYFALVMSQCSTLEEAAGRLGVDRRTLNRLLDADFLGQLK